MTLVAQIYYIQNNFKSASESTRALVKAAQGASKPVKEEWLQLLMSSEFKQDNNAGVMSALEQLVASYPKDQYWKDLIRLNEASMKGASTKTNLDIYAVKFYLGLVATPEEYSDMTQLALQEGLPGTAKRVMEKGMGSGVLGQGAQKERENRLLTMANTQADTDQKSLDKGEAEAKKQKTGDALVKFGEAYASYGQFDKAVETIQAGIAKGPQNADDAKLRLGIALIQAGKRAQALDAFRGITAGSVQAQIARLWSLASASKRA
jgi:tetratricopeptide (TPR) repeat protein